MVVGEHKQNVTMLTDAFRRYAVITVTSPEQPSLVLTATLPAELVVVDTVSDDVTVMVETLLDEALSVVLLAEEASPLIRRAAAETEELTLGEKPLRNSDLRTVVGEQLT